MPVQGDVSAPLQAAARGPVLVVGPLPPPVTGFSQVTVWFDEALREAAVPTLRIPTLSTVPVGTPALRRRMRRSLTILAAWWRVFRALYLSRPSARAVYLPISGGIGQGLELPLAAMARVAGVPLLIHHHSFAYLTRRSRLTALLLRVAGPMARQVVLGRSMAVALQRNYGVAEAATLVLSNAAFVVPGAASGAMLPARAEGAALVIGFLGNVSRAKGALVFVEVCELLARARVAFSAVLAGPFEDVTTEAEVRRRAGSLPQLQCLGPVFDARKSAFLASLDVLLFPSDYVNEAEPVTILEALSCGVPVIATQRGCIPDLLAADDEFALVDGIERYAEVAARRISALAADPALRARRRETARARFDVLQRENRAALAGVHSMLGAGWPAGVR